MLRQVFKREFCGWEEGSECGDELVKSLSKSPPKWIRDTLKRGIPEEWDIIALATALLTSKKIVLDK